MAWAHSELAVLQYYNDTYKGFIGLQVSSMGIETPCHLWCDDITTAVQLIVHSFVIKKTDTLTTQMRLDSGEGEFDRIVVGGVG